MRDIPSDNSSCIMNYKEGQNRCPGRDTGIKTGEEDEVNIITVDWLCRADGRIYSNFK